MRDRLFDLWHEYKGKFFTPDSKLDSWYVIEDSLVGDDCIFFGFVLSAGVRRSRVARIHSLVSDCFTKKGDLADRNTDFGQTI
jgi:hypothetical protein